MAKARPVVVVSFLLLASGGVGSPQQERSVPLFDGLGGLSRKVTTASPEAQRYFDQGLAFLYAFNHDEAIRAFRRAARARPEVRHGLLGRRRSRTARTSTTRWCPRTARRRRGRPCGQAQAVAAGASPVEKALIEALASRYALPAARGPQASRRRPTPTRCARSGRPTRRTPTSARSSRSRSRTFGPGTCGRRTASRSPVRRSSSRRSSPCSPSTRGTPSPTT